MSLPELRMPVFLERSTDSDTANSIGMKLNVSFESAVCFTKKSVYLAWTWPPPRLANKWSMTKHNIALMLAILNVLAHLLPELMTIYVHRSNSVIVTQTSLFVVAGFTYIVKALMYKTHQKRMQILIAEMEDFCKKPRRHEKVVLQYYLDRCSIYHAAITFLNYVTAVAIICGPLFLSQPLPTKTIYPFPVESGIGKYLVYIHQSVAGFQFSAMLTTDCQIALIMWYTAARLEILAGEFKEVLGVKQLSSFVQKHQKLLSYAGEVSDTMGYAALMTSSNCGCGMVMSGMQIAGNTPITLKMQYAPMIVISMLNLFTCAWPAENLLRACDLMANAVYNASWIHMPTELVKDLQFVLRRSQQPVRVSLGGIFPTLSLRYYALFLSTAFSYFTTLRAVMMGSSKE